MPLYRSGASRLLKRHRAYFTSILTSNRLVDVNNRLIGLWRCGTYNRACRIEATRRRIRQRNSPALRAVHRRWRQSERSLRKCTRPRRARASIHHARRRPRFRLLTVVDRSMGDSVSP